MTTTPPNPQTISKRQEPIRILDMLKHPTQGTTSLYLVRHGQTAGNVNHQLVGSTDMPLNELGERQATQVGTHFESIELDAVLTSPLRRAQTTAERIATATGRNAETIPGLTEMSFGEWEGMTIAQIMAKFPEAAARIDDLTDMDFEYPGGDHRQRFHERTLAVFTGILERYTAHSVAAICHGGVIGSFLAQIEGGQPNDFVRYAVRNCSVTHLEITPDATHVHLWDHVDHLDEVAHAPLKLTPSMAGADES